MKTLYLDCGMGAAGDMLAAALLELVPHPEAVVEKLNALGIPGVTMCHESAVKCGITGSSFRVLVRGQEEDEHLHDHHHNHDHHHEHDHHEHEHTHAHDHAHTHDHAHSHHHSSLSELEHLVQDHMALEEAVKADILAVYRRLAEAESHVHGMPVADIHFHEVGTLDALADVTAVCLLMHELAPDEVVASPVHAGSGTVRCAHGILPVPAPATAELLRGVPIYGGSVEGELCTPTGAALLTHFVSRFGDMPVLRTEAVGYGMGKKDFPRANCLRAILGETEDDTDAVAVLTCNVDDMTAEALGWALDRLYAGGALEAFTLPAGMKKNRPGTLLQVLCRPEDREAVARLLFRHTTTIGVRQSLQQRYTLRRTVSEVETPWGTVRRKDAEGYGVRRSKYEYDDLTRIAARQDWPLEQVLRALPDCET